MDKFLLDTHTLLWWHENDSQLSTQVKEIILNPGNRIEVSIISFWEIVIKQTVGKLKLKYSIEELIENCIKNNFRIITMHFLHLNQLSVLPLIHRDPFDRYLIATAMCENLQLLSKDKHFSEYHITVFW